MIERDGIISAKIIHCIETESLKGNGDKNSPVRIVKKYWTIDGELLAENDPDQIKDV